MSIGRKIITGPEYIAVTENGLLTEYIPYDPADRNGDILLGRIERLMPEMKCAFVDIGRKKSGFLPLDGDSRSFTGDKIRSGETVILQIKKEETGEKGAYLTRDVTLPGQTVILMPMNRYVGVSSRIRDEDVRERLRQTGCEIADGRFGLVMRNAAAESCPDLIREEAERLLGIWLETAKRAAEGGKPGTVLLAGDPAVRIREDYAVGGYEEIVTEEGPGPEIRRQLKEARERTMWLPGGGNIVIDRCEAMTVIDVNTASAAGSGSKERTVTETNLEACETIARQVRLRNIAGIILIDFVDMEEETDQSLVLEKLKEYFSRDRIKTVIHGWTRLGIMEMTRKRTRGELTFQSFSDLKL